MEQVICRRCGTMNDYKIQKKGPHIEAICNGCDRHIKFLQQNKNGDKSTLKSIALELYYSLDMVVNDLECANAACGHPEYNKGAAVTKAYEVISKFRSHIFYKKSISNK